MERDLLAAQDCAGSDPSARLAAMTRAHALLHTRYRKDARVANLEILSLPEPVRSEVIALRERVRELFKDVIANGIQAGVFANVDVFLTQAAILNMSIHIADWFRPEGRLSADEVADAHAELALRLVAAREAK